MKVAFFTLFLVVLVETVILPLAFSSPACHGEPLHVLLFASRTREVEAAIRQRFLLAPVEGKYAADKYTITDRAAILGFAERGFIRTVGWELPREMFVYHVRMRYPPTDAWLLSLEQWANEATGADSAIVQVSNPVPRITGSGVPSRLLSALAKLEPTRLPIPGKVLSPVQLQGKRSIILGQLKLTR